MRRQQTYGLAQTVSWVWAWRMASSPCSSRVKGSIDGGGPEFMFAAKISFERTRLLHVDDGTNELPSLGKVGRWTTLLEVVNVDYKKSSEFRVTENAGPIAFFS